MNTSQALTTSVAPGRALNITLWTLQVLLGALFAFAGINKLLGLQPEMVDNFARLGVGVWFRYLVGVLELVGAALLVTPRLAPVGALWLAGVMVGAVFTHLFFLPPVAVALAPGVLATLLCLIAWGRRAELAALRDR